MGDDVLEMIKEKLAKAREELQAAQDLVIASRSPIHQRNCVTSALVVTMAAVSVMSLPVVHPAGKE